MEVLVIHARRFTDRKAHIERLLHRHHLQGIYILDGDMEDLKSNELDRFFVKDSIMHTIAPFVSCSIKHFYAYEYIIKQNLSGALIIEDDMVLSKNFNTIFSQSLQEYKSKYTNKPIIISYENTRLRFVPRSKRKKGQVLYQGDRDRMAGCYYINRLAAEVILDKAIHEKCSFPIDNYHNKLLHKGLLVYLWCEPTIAEQGSFNGLFHSRISNRYLLPDKIRWRTKLIYKRMLYYFR